MNGMAQSPGPRRWLAHPWLSLMIGGSWVLLQGSLAPVHWIWAAVLGLLLPWVAHDFIPHGGPVRSIGVILGLVLTVLWDIVVANLVVARLVVHPAVRPRPAWIRVPYTLDDPWGVVLLATIITTTPGTVSALVDEQRREILVHVLDCTDPQAVAAAIQQRYEAPLQEIFR